MTAKNKEYFEQAKKEGRIDKDAEYEDFIDYSPITEKRAKRVIERSKENEIKIFR